MSDPDNDALPRARRRPGDAPQADQPGVARLWSKHAVRFGAPEVIAEVAGGLFELAHDRDVV